MKFISMSLQPRANLSDQFQIEEPTHARYSPVIRPKQSNFGYDSDFSLASTSSAYDTDSDVSYSPELTSKVPPFCMRTPEIPTGRFKWECPGCEYIIDLLNLTEDNTRGLPSELGNFLHRKSWQYLNEEKVKWVMQNMISNHYISHLRKNGVQVVRRQNKVCSWQINCYGNDKSFSVTLHGIRKHDICNAPPVRRLLSVVIFLIIFALFLSQLCRHSLRPLS